MTRQKYKIPSANTAVTKARGIHSVLLGGGFELLEEVPDVHTKAMIAVTNAITDLRFDSIIVFTYLLLIIRG